jgi:hypothetical protein
MTVPERPWSAAKCGSGEPLLTLYRRPADRSAQLELRVGEGGR